VLAGCESELIGSFPGTPNLCMCVGWETPLPGLEYHGPNRRQAEARGGTNQQWQDRLADRSGGTGGLEHRLP
jgi:hypothetical protein